MGTNRSTSRSAVRVLALISFLIVSACMQETPATSANAIKDVSVEYDSFRDETIISTPYYLSRQGFTDTFPASISYRAVKKNGSITLLGLYVEKVNTDWGFYTSATGQDGYDFNFREVDSSVDSGGGIVTTEENFFLGASVAQLRKMAQSDYQVKVYGRRDSGVFVVPASISKAFMQVVDSQ